MKIASFHNPTASTDRHLVAFQPATAQILSVPLNTSQLQAEFQMLHNKIDINAKESADWQSNLLKVMVDTGKLQAGFQAHQGLQSTKMAERIGEIANDIKGKKIMLHMFTIV